MTPAVVTLADAVSVITPDGARHRPPGAQVATVLAVLALEHRRPVRQDEIAEVLWPERLPAHWRGAVRGLVARLRAFLAGLGHEVATAGPCSPCAAPGQGTTMAHGATSPSWRGPGCGACLRPATASSPSLCSPTQRSPSGDRAAYGPLLRALQPYDGLRIVLNCYGGGGATWGLVRPILAELDAAAATRRL